MQDQHFAQGAQDLPPGSQGMSIMLRINMTREQGAQVPKEGQARNPSPRDLQSFPGSMIVPGQHSTAIRVLLLLACVV